ncbi:MAG: hypothetical protein QM749_03520 [Aquabacterium sp.]
MYIRIHGIFQIGVNMNTSFAFRTSLGAFALFVLGAFSSQAAVAADAASAVVSKEVAKRAGTVAVKPAAATVAGKVAVKTGATVGKADDNQYPSGSPIVPPKPKKDGPEAAAAAAAIKAKTSAVAP